MNYRPITAGINELNPRKNIFPKIKSGCGMPYSTEGSLTEVSTLIPILFKLKNRGNDESN